MCFENRLSDANHFSFLPSSKGHVIALTTPASKLPIDDGQIQHRGREQTKRLSNSGRHTNTYWLQAGSLGEAPELKPDGD
jgi:hypothetical protein